MKYQVYDISQELTNSTIYPGDLSPKLEVVKQIDKDLYNLSNLHICLHNGTHIDAPKHFIKDGKDIENIEINKFVGFAYVTTHNGIITKEKALIIMNKAIELDKEASKKILIKGDGIVSSEAAQIFLEYNVELIGTELTSVGDPNAPMEVHKILLEKEVVLLEGLNLNKIDEGIYFLNCAPLSIKNAEGSPTRAILIKF